MLTNQKILIATQLLVASCLSPLSWPASADVPVIQVWYGPSQSFGALGQPQQWVNILGNVSDADGISALTYSLNGAPSKQLSLGPDGRRLSAAGDFNVELAFTELQVGPNSLVISATDGVGEQASSTVNVDYAGVNVWPGSYATNCWRRVRSASRRKLSTDCGAWKVTVCAHWRRAMTGCWRLAMSPGTISRPRCRSPCTVLTRPVPGW